MWLGDGALRRQISFQSTSCSSKTHKTKQKTIQHSDWIWWQIWTLFASGQTKEFENVCSCVLKVLKIGAVQIHSFDLTSLAWTLSIAAKIWRVASTSAQLKVPCHQLIFTIKTYLFEYMCSAPITVSTLSCLKKAKFPMYIKLLWNMECTSYSFCPVLPEWGRIFLHIESVIECRHTARWPLAANLTRAPVHRRKDLQCLTTGQQPNWNILITHTKKHRRTSTRFKLL